MIKSTKIDQRKENLKNAFGKAAKVVKKYPTQQRLPYLIVAIGILFLFIVIGGHHHKKTHTATSLKSHKIEEASLILKQKLDELNQQKHTDSLQTNLVSHKHKIVSDNYSKALLTRMNTPTVIYESSITTTMPNQTTSNTTPQEALFMGKGVNEQFASQGAKTSLVIATRIPHPEATIVSGEMLQATLNVASNSDLPGMVTATVTTPAYSYTEENELIPAGSRLIGQYSSAVLQGQDRIFVMWNRLVLPNGISVNISSPDTDKIGQAGEGADVVNRHFWSRFGESILMSILSAGVSNIDVNDNDEYNSAQAYRMAIAQSLQQSAAGTLEKTISQKPTLIRYQGARINVFIAQDLSFYKVLKQQGRL